MMAPPTSRSLRLLVLLKFFKKCLQYEIHANFSKSSVWTCIKPVKEKNVEFVSQNGNIKLCLELKIVSHTMDENPSDV